MTRRGSSTPTGWTRTGRTGGHRRPRALLPGPSSSACSAALPPARSMRRTTPNCSNASSIWRRGSTPTIPIPTFRSANLRCSNQFDGGEWGAYRRGFPEVVEFEEYGEDAEETVTTLTAALDAGLARCPARTVRLEDAMVDEVIRLARHRSFAQVRGLVPGLPGRGGRGSGGAGHRPLAALDRPARDCTSTSPSGSPGARLSRSRPTWGRWNRSCSITLP